MPDSRLMIGIVLVTITMVAPLHAEPPAAETPNIVFILADGLGAGLTGFEGHPLVQTPHLDRLAQRSARFTRCHTPIPQDSPARASILTGLYPHEHGVMTDSADAGPAWLSPQLFTFTSRLARAGYACGVVGKWVLPADTAGNPGFGFEAFVATDGPSWSWENSPVFINGEAATADGFLTDWHGQQALTFIEQSRESPFLLWLCFRGPEPDPVYPPSAEDAYPVSSIELPATMTVDANSRPRAMQAAEPIKRFNQNNSPAKLKELRSKYYALITRMDENIGRVLDRIEELELARNTIIVFTSTHGWAIGEHGLYGAGPFFYDELVRVPLLIHDPDAVRGGSQVERVVSLLDLAPTILIWAGLDVPPYLPGQALQRLMANADDAGHADEAFLCYENQGQLDMPARGVLTAGYKYVEYLSDKPVLYDLYRDPFETRNMAEDMRYKGIVLALSSRLDQWRWQSQDPEYDGTGPHVGARTATGGAVRQPPPPAPNQNTGQRPPTQRPSSRRR